MHNLDSIIGRYLAGEATAKEQQLLHEWLEKDPANKVQFELLQSFFESKEENSKTLQQKNWDKIHAKIHLHSPKPEYPVHRPVHEKQSFIWVTLAAACVGFLFFFLGFMLNKGGTSTDQSAALLEEIMVEREVPLGQRARFKLTDGTVVKVNAGSKIVFPQSFRLDKREVWLEGEAFFDVAEDLSRPFIIHTGNVKTTVLGTSFNVKSTANYEEVRVSVLTGKVKVEDVQNKMKVHLSPTEAAVLDADKKGIRKEAFDYDETFGWTENRLIFTNNAFPEVIERLEHWYGFKFIIGSHIGRLDIQDYNAQFNNQSLESVLENLCYSYDLSYKINVKQKQVTLMKKNNTFP